MRSEVVACSKKDEFTVQISRERNGVKEARSFGFDSAFSHKSQQAEVRGAAPNRVRWRRCRAPWVPLLVHLPASLYQVIIDEG